MMTQNVKNQSFALANILSSFGISVPHSTALEVLAQLNGAKDWNVFAATGKKSLHLNAEQTTLLEAVVKIQNDTYGPTHDGELLHVSCGGLADGSFALMGRMDMRKPYATTASCIQLAIRSILAEKSPVFAVFLFVTLVGKNDTWVVSDVAPMSIEELYSQTFSIELRRASAVGTGICPIMGVLRETEEGVFAFVDGSPHPVYSLLIPQRVWEVAQEIANNSSSAPSRFEDGTRIVLTIGEVAECYAQYQKRKSW